MKKQRWSLLISQKICCGSTLIAVNPCEYKDFTFFYSIAVDFFWWSNAYLFKGGYLRELSCFLDFNAWVFFSQLCLPCPIWQGRKKYNLDLGDWEFTIWFVLNLKNVQFHKQPLCVCVQVFLYWLYSICCCFIETCLCVCVCQGQGWWLWDSGSRWHACGVRPRRLPQCCGFPPQPLLQTTRSNLQQLHFLLEPGKFVCPPEPRQHSHHLDTHSACTQPASSV